MARYDNQEKFEGIGDKSGELREKTIMIVGVGGLGSVVADMLHREGLNIRIIDKGRIKLEDMQRQTIYTIEDENRFKAKQIKKQLEEINPKNTVKTFHEELNNHHLFLLDKADIVIDCSNNLKTNKMIGDYIKKKKPLITCKYAGSEGVIFISDRKHYFKDVLKKFEKVGDIKKKGAISAAPHLAAGIIVSQALKTLVGQEITDNLITFDVWKDRVRRVSI